MQAIKQPIGNVCNIFNGQVSYRGIATGANYGSKNNPDFATPPHPSPSHGQNGLHVYVQLWNYRQYLRVMRKMTTMDDTQA